MATTYLTETNTTSGTRTKWTASFWVKRGNLGSENIIYGSYLDGSNQDKIAFNTGNQLQFSSYQAASFSNGGLLQTNRVFRDTSAWYHIVLRWDTANATADDRMKIWINGVEETSFASRTNPTSSRESLININGLTTIGALNSGSYFDGSISHIHFCDGYAYSASDFGETDANGVWKIKTSPSVSYGTKGYFILKDGNSVTDQSGNGNNWTVAGGTLTNTEDNPSNVFATGNILLKPHSNITFSNGNNTAAEGGTDWGSLVSTLGASSGKYYFEVKLSSGSNCMIGITNENTIMSTAGTGGIFGKFGYGISYRQNGEKYQNDAGSAYGSSYSSGDIIGVAVDLDNSNLYFSKNGTWQNSGDPTSGATGTGAISITPTSTAGNYMMGASPNTSTVQANFGNGYFGTTAVASAGTNASGIGIFEYDVPTGYTALSTKGLNS